jgi:hypothetical protein
MTRLAVAGPFASCQGVPRHPSLSKRRKAQYVLQMPADDDETAESGCQPALQHTDLGQQGSVITLLPSVETSAYWT